MNDSRSQISQEVGNVPSVPMFVPKADQAARVGAAAKTGLLANLVFAEGLALGSEVDSALNGTCK